MGEVFAYGSARPMSTWMDLLYEMGVFGQEEVCKWCKREPGTEQVYQLNQHGERMPTHKVCKGCMAEFKKPRKRRRAR